MSSAEKPPIIPCADKSPLVSSTSTTAKDNNGTCGYAGKSSLSSKSKPLSLDGKSPFSSTNKPSVSLDGKPPLDSNGRRTSFLSVPREKPPLDSHGQLSVGSDPFLNSSCKLSIDSEGKHLPSSVGKPSFRYTSKCPLTSQHKKDGSPLTAQSTGETSLLAQLVAKTLLSKSKALSPPPQTLNHMHQSVSSSPVPAPLDTDNSDVWINFPPCPLLKEDREIIESNAWLNDKIINAAQKMLQLQAADISGWQSYTISRNILIIRPLLLSKILCK